MRLPAVCDTCGNIFPSTYSVENSRNITFAGSVRSGPCPKCGGWGHIPDGVYNVIGSTIELLSGPDRSVTELRRLAKILENARNNHSSFEEITQEIDNEVPELSSISDLLPKTRSELYSILGVVVAAIISIISLMSDGPSNIEINNVINNIYKQGPSTQMQQPPKSVKPEKKKKNLVVMIHVPVVVEKSTNIVVEC